MRYDSADHNRRPLVRLALAVLLVLLGATAWSYWVTGGKELTLPLITAAWYAAIVFTFPQLTQNGPIPGIIAGVLSLLSVVLVLCGLATLAQLQSPVPTNDYRAVMILGVWLILVYGWPVILISGGVGWLAQRVLVGALPSNSTLESDARKDGARVHRER